MNLLGEGHAALEFDNLAGLRLPFVVVGVDLENVCGHIPTAQVGDLLRRSRPHRLVVNDAFDVQEIPGPVGTAIRCVQHSDFPCGVRR